MKLKAVYDKQTDIPQGFEELYEERDGKWCLTQIEGIKTEADVVRVQRALNQATEARKTAEKALADYKAMGTVEEVQAKLDRVEELEAGAVGGANEEKINTLVEARIKARLAPVERERDKYKKQAEEKEGEVTKLSTEIRVGKLQSEVRKFAESAKVVPQAIDDILLLAERVFEIDDNGKVVTKDNVGFTPGLSPDVWFTDMKDKRPHWWPASQGGGGKGSGSAGGTPDNPWSAEHWNVTKQGQVLMTLGEEKAETMAKQVGSHLGATRPPAQRKSA